MHWKFVMMIQVQGIYYADMAGLGLGLFRGKCVCVYICSHNWDNQFSTLNNNLLFIHNT